MADYEFTMPWPPSVNAWKSPFRNRMILTKRGRQYRIDAINVLEFLNLKGEKIEGPVSVFMILNPPTLRRYDIDNFTKSLFDAMSHAEFWIDDEQIQSLTIKKGDKTKDGNIELKINKI